MIVTIDKLVFGGAALTHTDSGVLFVEGALPGEKVEVSIVGKKGGISFAKVTKVLEASPSRIDPACPYFGICGGCDWQHIDYSEQLRQKIAIAQECFLRIGKIILPHCEEFSAKPWEYRIRMQLQIDRATKKVGFFARNTNNVVQINQCPLLSPDLNTLLSKKDAWVNSLNEILQLKVIGGKTIVSDPVLKNYTHNQTEIEVNGKNFIVDGSSFFQGNRFLHDKVGLWANDDLNGERFIDLYGGLGFFSLLHADRFKRGVLVENITKQTKRAALNFTKNSIDHIDTLAISAEIFFKNYMNAYPGPDTIIVDPPRIGLSRMVRLGIRNLAPHNILYLSCNPSTQARDVSFFVSKCGYKIKRAALFDLYPQTHHIEMGLLLEK